MTIELSDEEYARLLAAAESDDTIVRCEECGAWMSIDEEAYATVDEFRGCWKAATRDPRFDQLCVAHRAPAPTIISQRDAA